MEKKRFHKVIAFIVLMVVIIGAALLGIGINALNFHIQESLPNLKFTKATKEIQTTTLATTVSNITFETVTLEVHIDNTDISDEGDTTQNAQQSTMESTEDVTEEIQSPEVSDISGTFVINTSWDGYYMYDLMVENNSSASVSSWEISVELPAGSSVSNYWCCKCALNGNVLTVTPEDYNGYIDAGAKISGIGITIATNSNMTDMVVKGNQTIVPQETTTANEETTNETTQGNFDTDPYVPPVLESGTPVSNHGKLSLDGTGLVDSKGNPFQLKGVSTHGIAWFPQYVNKEAFKTLRDEWGVNTIRLAMYTAEYNGYCTGGSQADLRQLVENGVEYATDLGMYVIIDWHILTDGNPNTYKTEAISFFGTMAAKYCNYDNVIYEICNEPNGGADWNTVRGYANEVISAIRRYDSDAIILVGTPTWSQDIDQVAANPVTNGYNVMYTLHFYAATHKDDLRNKLIKAIEAGTPAFISEFSICDASGNGGIDYTSAKAWKDLINKYNLSYAGWSLSNKDETSALIKSTCSKLSEWTTEDLSDAGKWLRDMISGT